MPAHSPAEPPAPGWRHPTASVILDTNVVLDWLVFHDPAVTELASAVETGVLRWIACARMRSELEHVLDDPTLARWQPATAQVMAKFDRHAVLCPAAPPAPTGIRCADPSDQMFVDLAMAWCPRWLVSHDRQILRMASQLARAGISVVKPALWRLHDRLLG